VIAIAKVAAIATVKVAARAIAKAAVIGTVKVAAILRVANEPVS